jgi:hypothetical protein
VPPTSLGRAPRPMTWGDFVMFPIQVLLSGICLAMGFAVLFGEEWHWGRPLAALFFLALGMATWTNLFSPRLRSVLSGLLMVAFGVSLVYVSLSLDHAHAYPRDCSGLRRPMGCYLENALHATGGALLVHAFWALIGVASFLAGVYALRGHPWRMRR